MVEKLPDDLAAGQFFQRLLSVIECTAIQMMWESIDAGVHKCTKPDRIGSETVGFLTLLSFELLNNKSIKNNHAGILNWKFIFRSGYL